MTAEMEFTGRNIKKAVHRAAQALGVADEDIKFDILSHGSTGIFGLAGIKKARIKVRPIAPEIQPIAEVSEQKAKSIEFEPTQPDKSAGSDEAQTIGEALLRRIVDAISPESKINLEKKANCLCFHIAGGQSGILIGKRGQTLEAIQLLVDKAVRRLDGPAARIQVDVEDYLAKKKAGLVTTAERLARKVTDKGNPASIGYLNAQDRRIVHLSLKNNKKVRTQSVGEGPYRKLMIYPRRKPKDKL